jgi:predicted metal-dependent hydrolase
MEILLCRFHRKQRRTIKMAQAAYVNCIAKPCLLRFTGRMWFEFMDKFRKRETPAAETVLVGSRQVPLLVVRNPRARRYLLRMRADGAARVTIPRGGSAAAAREFVDRNRPWLERQWQQMQARPRHPAALQIGSTVLFRGELVPIQSDQPGCFRFDTEILPMPEPAASLRPVIEKHLRKLAARELPARLAELASLHGFAVKRVTVRGQRTRWGSCSQRGGISLNWRLIQTPAHVRDYIMLHELAHLRQMNHSNRFWHEVERLCPNYEMAERWLKDHRGLLRDA